MNCSTFLTNFSDFLDGSATSEVAAEAEAHLGSCEDCRRYHDVMVRGRELLRSFPEVEVSDDFYPRLQHRIYNEDEADAHGARPSSSGAPASTVLGMAAILTLAAWAPVLRSAPEVRLSPIVVSRPAASEAAPPPSAAGLLPLGATVPLGLAGSAIEDLWRHPRSSLYLYSPLSERYRREPSVRRTGLD